MIVLDNVLNKFIKLSLLYVFILAFNVGGLPMENVWSALQILF